jgi:hypothetical protein
MEKIPQRTKSNDIPLKFDSRYVFSDTLIRISRVITEEKLIENMIMSTQLPYVFTEEPIPLEFEYNMTEALVKDAYSKIVWLLTNKSIPSPIQISFHLTENTIEKTVFVIFEIELVNRKLIPEKYCDEINKSFPKICVEIVKNIDKELEEYKNNIYHYESKIFNYPREKIWNIITNFHIKMFEAGAIKNLSDFSPLKEGSEIKFNMCEDNKFFHLKITKVKCDENNDKWILSTKPISGPFEHFLQEWILIKLSENQVLLANNSKYNEHISPENNKNISEQKKLTFNLIEEMLKSNIDKNKKSIINLLNEKKKKIDAKINKY